MGFTKKNIRHIQALKQEYDQLKKGKEVTLAKIDEAEQSEAVYNSNAIENSSLTLPETEKILVALSVTRNIDLRAAFEAKNLATIMTYIRAHTPNQELTRDFILQLHVMLMSHINDSGSGRFRQVGEYVRIRTYVAPGPEKIEGMMAQILLHYSNAFTMDFLEKIAKFHLDFELIHPFSDGNGRIGRVLLNDQLHQLGFPSVIIRAKDKKLYYKAFSEYKEKNKTKPMETILFLALSEALHKRIAYLNGDRIMSISEYADTEKKSLATLLNAARRQTIPAFREKGVWKIGSAT